MDRWTDREGRTPSVYRPPNPEALESRRHLAGSLEPHLCLTIQYRNRHGKPDLVTALKDLSGTNPSLARSRIALHRHHPGTGDGLSPEHRSLIGIVRNTHQVLYVPSVLKVPSKEYDLTAKLRSD